MTVRGALLKCAVVLGRELERRGPGRFDVVNLSVSGYGTHQEVLMLRRFGGVGHLYTLLTAPLTAGLAERLARLKLVEPPAPDTGVAARESPDVVSRPVRITEALIGYARDEARRLGAGFLVVVIPEEAQVLGGAPSADPELDRHVVADALDPRLTGAPGRGCTRPSPAMPTS